MKDKEEFLKDNKKVVIVTRGYRDEDNDDDQIVAVFSDINLALEFINRPIGKNKKYEITETSLDPEFCVEDKKIFYIKYDPEEEDSRGIFNVNSFHDETDALVGKIEKRWGEVSSTVFANSESEAFETLKSGYLMLKASGKWDDLPDLGDDIS